MFFSPYQLRHMIFGTCRFFGHRADFPSQIALENRLVEAARGAGIWGSQ